MTKHQPPHDRTPHRVRCPGEAPAMEWKRALLGQGGRCGSRHRRDAAPTMPAEMAQKWMALLLGVVVLSTGCVTVTLHAGRGALLDHNPRAVLGPELAGAGHVDARKAATDRCQSQRRKAARSVAQICFAE